jgi:hypothetical protein
MKKARTLRYRAFVIYGRRGGIRTRDPLHPMQVRYQAALHAEDRYCSLKIGCF